MTDFKVGDVVALITQPWDGRFIVTKVVGSKLVVETWNDWGFFGRLFPLRKYTFSAAMVQYPRVDHDGPKFAGCVSGPEKPPVSDPVAPEVQPL
jgi:hypothetical protein